MSPEQMLERVGELEKYKKEEEKERRKEEMQKKKDLVASKKKLVREIQTTSKDMRKHEKEANKLQTQVRKIETQMNDSMEKRAKTEEKFDDVIQSKSSKQRELERLLTEKMEETGLAEGRLAHLEFAQKMLEQGVIVSTDPADGVNGSYEQKAIKSAGEPPQAVLSKEDAEEVELLRDEVQRLQEENSALCSKLEANFRMIKAQEQRIESMSQTLEVQQTTLLAVETQLQADNARLKESPKTRTDVILDSVEVLHGTHVDVIPPKAEVLSGRAHFTQPALSPSVQSLPTGFTQPALSNVSSGRDYISSPNQPGVLYAGQATPVAVPVNPATQPTIQTLYTDAPVGMAYKFGQDAMAMNSAIRMGSAPHLTAMTRAGDVRDISPPRLQAGFARAAYSGVLTPPMGRTVGFQGGPGHGIAAYAPGYSVGGAYANQTGYSGYAYGGAATATQYGSGYSYGGVASGGAAGLGTPVSVFQQPGSAAQGVGFATTSSALGTQSSVAQSSIHSFSSAVQTNSQFNASAATGVGTSDMSTQTSKRGSHLMGPPSAETSTAKGHSTFAQAVHKMTAQALKEYRQNERVDVGN